MDHEGGIVGDDDDEFSRFSNTWDLGEGKRGAKRLTSEKLEKRDFFLKLAMHSGNGKEMEEEGNSEEVSPSRTRIGKVDSSKTSRTG